MAGPPRCLPIRALLEGQPSLTFALERNVMIVRTLLVLSLLAQAVLAQSNVYTGRIIGHTPFYERILIPKGNLLRPQTLRGVDDLRPDEHYSATNRIDRIFAVPSNERTNSFYVSCLAEVPVTGLSLRCPGDLLDAKQVRELLRDTVVVPRALWTNHVRSGPEWRYVFSLRGSKDQEYVIDERAGAFALVFFPDGTYRCVVGPGYGFLPVLQPDGAANRSQPTGSDTSRASPAAGSGR